REVAIKVLPAQFTQDPQRLARFEREAQLLASLNHPNIAAIYSFEHADGLHFLVLELVEGETLAERLHKGPLPVEEALEVCRQIAEGVEAAHEKGVIHRDLKPANVKITPEGKVKILDFGLAKAFEGEAPLTDISQSPTLTEEMTRAGVILGTAAYMSPEQAKGKSVDKRADIFAFGCLLCELLTGKKVFEGETITETIAAVLKSEPDWRALPKNTPWRIRELLDDCLQKEADDRLHDISHARIQIKKGLKEPATVSPIEGVSTAQQGRWRRAIPLSVAALFLSAAVAGAVALILQQSPEAPAEVTRFRIRSPSGEYIAPSSPIALSRDARRLVYGVGGDLSSSGRLFLHNLESFDARPLEGAENVANPFFAPDGNSIGFVSRSPGSLRQLSLAGGAPTSLVESTLAMAGSWGQGGTVVFALDWGHPLRLARVDRSETTTLTHMDSAAGERAHLWPQILPGNRAVLFTIWTAAPSWDEALLAVADLETGQHKVILRRGASGRYAASGHLVFWRGDALMAAPFDLDGLEVSGEPVKVLDGVRLNGHNGGAHFALSETGTLAYVSGGLDNFSESFVVERSGRELLRLDRTGAVGDPTFSPDGQRVALTLFKGGTFWVGVYDLRRDLLTPIAFAGDNLLPTWTPDGERITYLSNPSGEYSHYSISTDGSGEPESVFTEAHGFCCQRGVWSPDGEQLLYAKPNEQTGLDIWILSRSQDASARPLVDDPGRQQGPVFSPDGRFIAYESDESGAPEIYVRPFPDVDRGRQRVSPSGGRNPVWSRDGREILYVAEKGLMSVAVAADRGSTSLSLGRPAMFLQMAGIVSFDVAPDGQTFAISRLPVEVAPRDIHVVLNWFEELKRLVPTGE
ncbi:protein kinase, partial [Acidobacteria bacterium AH-259-A15]|nr:protein kinase [Acidobacteria bacterium AH-259-A15]